MSEEALEEKTLRLDKWQGVVLSMAIGFAKECRIAKINGKRMPKPDGPRRCWFRIGGGT